MKKKKSKLTKECILRLVFTENGFENPQQGIHQLMFQIMIGINWYVILQHVDWILLVWLKYNEI